ncbi:hypothetical protein EB796_006505 [Bugula neritina]|uniref:Uncharacterized protein n=1 Tax=Bugula neritina TaxID=10212 RepID=A0A7J7KAE1_BUGNE|nr:hypothetical protein EB796_006505 [Bugula neritina]
MSHHVFTALYKSYLDKREKLLVEKCSGLEKAEAELQNERKLFESERVASRKEPIAKTVDRLLCKADDITEDAQTEIGVLQQMIQDILKIRCSPMVSREELKHFTNYSNSLYRILSEDSPFINYTSLSATILEDTLGIIKKDVAHCDYPWPLGNHDNGELYKVYNQNWLLKVELEKYKYVLEQLKHPPS